MQVALREPWGADDYFAACLAIMWDILHVLIHDTQVDELYR